MVDELSISLFSHVGSPITQQGLHSEQQTQVASRLLMFKFIIPVWSVVYIINSNNIQVTRAQLPGVYL